MQSTFILGPIQTKWLESLEQHPERQMKQLLGRKQPDGSYRACCLGELAIIAGCSIWDGDRLLSTHKEVPHATNTAAIVEYQSLGLYSELGHAKDMANAKSLSELNDTGTTWPQIAAIIRANPEMYLNKSV